MAIFGSAQKLNLMVTGEIEVVEPGRLGRKQLPHKRVFGHCGKMRGVAQLPNKDQNPAK